MGALGSSPSYYDFDSFEEMNVSTGGSDVAVQTAGAQLNMVTKRGTNDVHGSARVIMSDRQLQSTNLSDELAAQLARSGSTQQGNALDNLQDYGMEMGGPLIKDKLWLWGSYGRSQINLVTAGGYPDKTLLVGFGGKLNAQLIPENTFTASYSDNDKQKQGRSAGPTRPPETSFTQTGPTKLYKLEDSHIFSSNVFATVAYSRVIGGFGFTTPGQTVAYQDESSIWHNSYYQYQTTRNQTQFTLAPSFFARTGDIGHEIKVGFNYRRTPISSVTAWPGGMISFAPGMYAADRGIAGFIRDSNRDVDQTYYSGYISDTLTMNKLTVNVGVRYDYQKGQNNPVALSDPKYNTTVWPEPGLKGFTVAGTDAVTWKDFAPRLSATYAINDKTLARVSYARFVNQLGGTIPTWNSNAANGGTYLYYYWDDANGNKKVDPGEVDFGAGLYSSYNVGPNGPNSAQAYNKTDPNLKAPKTDEIILGFERQLAPTIVASVNGTWRHFSDQIEYAPLSADGSRILNPGDYTCAVRGPYPVPGGGSPQMITVCNPKPGVAGEARMETNRPGLTYDYWALDFNLVKRYADKWMARFNFTYSDERQHGIDQGQTDPANLITGTEAAGGLVVYGTGTVSGKTYVYVNSRWSVNLSGMYTLPYDFNLSTSLLARQGYPVPYYIRVAASGVPSYAQVKNYQLGNVDDVRLPAVVEWDLGLSKVVKTGPLSITLMVDCFNVLNRNTVLQRSPRVYDAAGSPVASNANDNLIYEQQSPRLFRFGARLSF